MSEDSGQLGMHFRAHPYVCGAIGRWSKESMGRLREASPGNLEEVHSSPDAALWATGRLSTWRTEGQHGIYWAPLAAGPAPSSWREAAEARLAAGLAFDDQGVVLHTCAVGYQELYVRRHQQALYFAVRIDPLLALNEARLSVDWSAWASILAVTSPLGDETPFREVRRMEGGAGWSARAGQLESISFEPSWLGVEPKEKLDADELVEVLGSHIGETGESAGLMLSGGWDSRLLAILARRATDSQIHAWTTSNDDGRDLDIEYARKVAEVLRLTHHVFVPEPEAWVEERSAVRQRIEYQSIHHIWMMPLARELHRASRPLLDGLAGDVLLKNLFVDADVVEAKTHTQRRRLQWEKLAQGRLAQPELFADGVAASFEEMSRQALDRAIGRFDGHPAASTLGVLHSRTTRAIAPSPLSILGPEVTVKMPFIHPEVTAAALRVPVESKLDGEFYRQILHSASPEVAALPSTNERREKPLPPPGPRRQSSAAALACMAETALGCEAVRGLLDFELTLALEDPVAREVVTRSRTVLRLLNWASLFAEWQARYADRLSASSFTPG